MIRIDENLCNGCALCIPNCPEGALQIIDGKARLVSETACDGLGACLGHCPEGALTVVDAEAAPYDEAVVMANIIGQGPNTIAAHLDHLEGHGQKEYLAQALAVLAKKGVADPRAKKVAMHAGGGCPGSRMMNLREEESKETGDAARQKSELRNWPLQLHLINPDAPYFDDHGLLVAADCAPFAHANFHADFVKGHTVTILCPKLDEGQEIYLEKLTRILRSHAIPRITVLHMEVPCCFGVVNLVRQAQAAAGTKIPLKELTITLRGEVR